MALSMFTLYQGLCGGVQVVCVATFGIIILWFASLYSSSRLVAICRMTALVCCVPPVWALLQFSHKLHAKVTLNPSKSSPACWLNIKCQRRSRKLSNLKPWPWTGMPDARQTSWALSHAHRACPIVSTPLPQTSQVGSSRTLLECKLDFVGRRFL